MADRLLRWLAQATDALVYGLVLTAVVGGGLGLVGGVVSALGFDWGWGLLGVKYGLFLVGWLVFGYGALQLRPRAAWKDDEGGTATPRSETRFQALVQSLPPARFLPLAPGERLSTAARIFVGSVLMLATSFVMGQVFGIVR